MHICLVSCKQAFAADVKKLWENAAAYNGEDNAITQYAYALREVFDDWMKTQTG
jgi:hypothetical protein